VKIVALTALATLQGLPSLFFTLLILSIAADFGVAAFLVIIVSGCCFFIMLKLRSWPDSDLPGGNPE
jgi:hypothetical protein